MLKETTQNKKIKRSGSYRPNWDIQSVKDSKKQRGKRKKKVTEYSQGRKNLKSGNVEKKLEEGVDERKMWQGNEEERYT